MTEAELTLIKNGFDQLNNGQQQINSRLDHLDVCVDSVRSQHSAHQLENESQFRDLFDSMKGLRDQMQELTVAVTSIVPDGDFQAHHDWHKSKMKWNNFFGNTSMGAIKKVIEYGLFTFALWLAVTIFGGLKVALHGDSLPVARQAPSGNHSSVGGTAPVDSTRKE